MTMTAPPLTDLATGRLPRLLPGRRDPSYAAHWERLGPLPALGRDLIDEVLASGLRGRGGARFPTGRKMAAVADRRGPAVLVANGTEGEPLSAKDRGLLVGNPHLVLDGITAAAAAVGANRILLAVERARPDTAAAVRHAIAERPSGPPIEVVQTPSRYVAGQETALVRWIDGGDAKPVFGSKPFQRGVGGRPTLVDNVETLAHIGLIARFGADWFRLLGPDDEPGSTLVTVSGAVRRPGVYEIPIGYPVEALLEQVEAAPAQALLVGGYFGAWVGADDLAGLRLSSSGLSAVGASPGSGVIVVVPQDACALAEVATVAAWYASHSAGQCGPCLFGLTDIARAVRGVLAGDADGEGAARRWTAMVRGRGACHFPDGAATFVDSALDALAAEVVDHRLGRCQRRTGGYLPAPAPGSWR
jgi:NADH:ubiquinone oxidoreductase subunit F (NADH-binding)